MQRMRFVLSTSCRPTVLNHLQPRKYNAVLERHGLKIAGGKLITTDGSGDSYNNQIEGKEPKTPGSTAKTSSKPSNSKPPKTPASKKRKMKAEKEEEEERETPIIKTELSELDKEILREKSEDEAE